MSGNRATNCTVNDLSGACGTEVALDILKQAKAAKDQQAAIGSLLRMEIILPNDLMKKDLIDILAPPFANRQNCSHNRTAKHIKNLLSSSRVITRPFKTFMNTSTSN